MKFRTDFVTNSSSSSYISVNYWALPAAQGTNEDFPGVVISCNKETKSDDGLSYPTHNSVYRGMASLFKLYCMEKQQVLGVDDFCRQTSIRNDFIEFINTRFGTSFINTDLLAWHLSYMIGYGESADISLEESTKRILSRLHPNILAAIQIERYPTEEQRQLSKRDVQIFVNQKSIRRDREFFSPRSQDDQLLHWDDASVAYFLPFYLDAGQPDLSADLMPDLLKTSALKPRDIQKILEQNLQILYLGDLFINNLIVFRKSGETDFQACMISELFECLETNSHSHLEPYLNIQEYKAEGEIQERYSKYISNIILEKYALTNRASEMETPPAAAMRFSDEQKKPISHTVTIGKVTLKILCKPKIAFANFEKLMDTLDGRTFYSSEFYHDHPDFFDDDMPTVPVSVAREKMIEYFKVVQLYLQADNLLRIATRAEKKKNGTLYKSRVQYLAWCEIATGGKFHALRAVNIDDNTIEIEIKRLDFSPSQIKLCVDLPSNSQLLAELKPKSADQKLNSVENEI